jgi:uncharacterized protein YgbK (DUF1537 family)
MKRVGKGSITEQFIESIFASRNDSDSDSIGSVADEDHTIATQPDLSVSDFAFGSESTITAANNSMLFINPTSESSLDLIGSLIQMMEQQVMIIRASSPDDSVINTAIRKLEACMKCLRSFLTPIPDHHECGRDEFTAIPAKKPKLSNAEVNKENFGRLAAAYK